MEDIPTISNNTTWSIYALGDDAVTIEFGNCISESYNRKVLQLFTALQKNPIPGMVEAVPAYSSLTVYYDIFFLRNKIAAMATVQQWVIQEIEKRCTSMQVNDDIVSEDLPIVSIPVCYEPAFAPDMDFICQQKKAAPAQIINLHTSPVYRVYMIGFLPGFAYMGETAEQLHISRKEKPVQVTKGSVGLAGRQTGIYPSHSPGGWQIIGRTPLSLFDASKQPPVLLKPGNRIQFYSISSYEFENY